MDFLRASALLPILVLISACATPSGSPTQTRNKASEVPQEGTVAQSSNTGASSAQPSGESLDALVGLWEHDSEWGTARWEFGKDGTFTSNMRNALPLRGEYTTLNNGRIKISAIHLGEAQTIEYAVRIVGNTATLEADGTTKTLRRINDGE